MNKKYPTFFLTWFNKFSRVPYPGLLEAGPNTKPGDHGTPEAHNRWFILFYHAWGPAWIEVHYNNIWLRVRSHMTSHYTWACVTTLHDFGGVLGTAFEHFLLGSHNFMVTALGSCVKWPLTKAMAKNCKLTYQEWPEAPKLPVTIFCKIINIHFWGPMTKNFNLHDGCQSPSDIRHYGRRKMRRTHTNRLIIRKEKKKKK
jgi:hypothetical protein